jgi:hypothetical protein
MNYTLEHLKIVHNAGAQKLSLDKTLELISLLDRNGLLHLVSDSGPSTKRKGRRKRRIQKAAKLTIKRRGRKRRGGLSESIIGFLSTKGASGAHVKDIVKAIKAPLASVRVWFYTSGKKYLKSREIKKVAPATFAYFKPAKAD